MILLVILFCIVLFTMIFLDFNKDIDELDVLISLDSAPQEGESFIIYCEIINLDVEPVIFTIPELGESFQIYLNTPEGKIKYSGPVDNMVPWSNVIEPGDSYKWNITVSPGSLWEDCSIPEGKYSLIAKYTSNANGAISGQEISNTVTFVID